MTNPDMATVLRDTKAPERTAGSQAVRAYPLSRLEQGEHAVDSAEEVKRLDRMRLISHLEVGAREERIAFAPYDNFGEKLERSHKCKRWL